MDQNDGESPMFFHKLQVLLPNLQEIAPNLLFGPKMQTKSDYFEP